MLFKDKAQPKPVKKPGNATKSRTARYILLGMLGLLILSTTAYLLGVLPDRSDPEKTPNPQITDSVKPSQAGGDSNKKLSTYQSDKYKVSFQYPKGWKIDEMTYDSYSVINVTSADYVFKTDRPNFAPESGHQVSIIVSPRNDKPLETIIKEDVGVPRIKQDQIQSPIDNQRISDLRVGLQPAKQYVWSYEGQFLRTTVNSGDYNYNFDYNYPLKGTPDGTTVDDTKKPSYEALLQSVKFL